MAACSSRRTPTTTSFEPTFPPPWADAPRSTLESQGGREEGPGPSLRGDFRSRRTTTKVRATHTVGEDPDVLASSRWFRLETVVRICCIWERHYLSRAGQKVGERGWSVHSPYSHSLR
jgi:hypothetical protein